MHDKNPLNERIEVSKLQQQIDGERFEQRVNAIANGDPAITAERTLVDAQSRQQAEVVNPDRVAEAAAEAAWDKVGNVALKNVVAPVEVPRNNAA